MKYKFLLGIIFIALFSFVLGQTIGTIITQNAFDNTDFSVRDLQITLDSVQKTENEMLVKISFLNLVKRPQGDWQVVSQTASFNVKLEDYHQCRLGGTTKRDCIIQAENDILSQAHRFKSIIRQQLTSNKTRGFEDEFTANDINLTSTQLNNA